MRNKIKSSLAAKVFLLTMLCLMCCGLAMYGFIAALVPQTYAAQLSGGLDEKSKELVAGLEGVTFEDSGVLFDAFFRNSDVSFLELVDSQGMAVRLPSRYGNAIAAAGDAPGQEAAVSVSEGDEADNTAAVSVPEGDEADNTAAMTAQQGVLEETVLESVYDRTPESMKSYEFSFAGSDARYTLLVYGNSQPVDELKGSLRYMLPLLLLLMSAVAAGMAFLFSRIVTRPILQTSRIAGNMSALSLDWHFDIKRTDEIGRLQRSLNQLSENLSAALRELQSANLRLQKDIEKEKQAEKARTEFFSAASHELKTPLMVIRGQMEGMLYDVGAYKDHKKYLERSLGVVDTMEELVREILTISRMQGCEEISVARFDLAQTVRDYLAAIECMAAQKELSITADMDEPLFVTGNRALLAAVVANLTGNAVFYSPSGSEIIITAKKEACSGEDAAGVFFCIENTGVHIPQEELPNIFDAFYRVERSRNRRTGGSGLGLAIVQEILRRHQSVCTAQNTERGVAFSFRLCE